MVITIEVYYIPTTMSVKRASIVSIGSIYSVVGVRTTVYTQGLINGLIIVGVICSAVLASISLAYAINTSYVSDRRNGEVKKFCLLGYEGTVDTGDSRCVIQYMLQSLVIAPLTVIFIGIPYAHYRCTKYPELVDRYRRLVYYVCIFGTITSWANYGYLEHQVGKLCTWINDSLNLVCLRSIIRTSEDVRPLESVDAMRKFHLGPPIYFMIYPILFLLSHVLERRLTALVKNA